MTTSELGYLLLGFGIGITAGYIYVAWMMRKESINMNAQLQTVNERTGRDKSESEKLMDTPEKIWLLDEGDWLIVWCDDPDPAGLGGDAPDSVAYVREKEVESLRQWQHDMVAKMAEDHDLDGYREMGERLAAKDKEIESLRHKVNLLEDIVVESAAAEVEWKRRAREVWTLLIDRLIEDDDPSRSENVVETFKLNNHRVAKWLEEE